MGERASDLETGHVFMVRGGSRPTPFSTPFAEALKPRLFSPTFPRPPSSPPEVFRVLRPEPGNPAVVCLRSSTGRFLAVQGDNSVLASCDAAEACTRLEMVPEGPEGSVTLSALSAWRPGFLHADEDGEVSLIPAPLDSPTLSAELRRRAEFFVVEHEQDVISLVTPRGHYLGVGKLGERMGHCDIEGWEAVSGLGSSLAGACSVLLELGAKLAPWRLHRSLWELAGSPGAVGAGFGERAWDAVRTCLAFAGLAAAFSLASLLQVACAPTLHAAWVQLWGIRGVGQGSALRIFVSCRLAASAAGLALAARDLTAQPAPSPASDWCLAALLAATAVLMLLWLCADLRDPYGLGQDGLAGQLREAAAGPRRDGGERALLGGTFSRVADDGAITASRGYSPWTCRIDNPAGAAWCPDTLGPSGGYRDRAYWLGNGRRCDEGQQGDWLCLDFGEVVRVTRVQTKGGEVESGRAAWVKRYRLDYSTDGYRWTAHPSELTGNVDRDGLRSNRLRPPIVASRLRLWPTSWHGEVALRVEVMGRSLTAGPYGPDPYGLDRAPIGRWQGDFDPERLWDEPSWDDRRLGGMQLPRQPGMADGMARRLAAGGRSSDVQLDLFQAMQPQDRGGMGAWGAVRRFSLNRASLRRPSFWGQRDGRRDAGGAVAGGWPARLSLPRLSVGRWGPSAPASRYSLRRPSLPRLSLGRWGWGGGEPERSGGGRSSWGLWGGAAQGRETERGGRSSWGFWGGAGAAEEGAGRGAPAVGARVVGRPSLPRLLNPRDVLLG